SKFANPSFFLFFFFSWFRELEDILGLGNISLTVFVSLTADTIMDSDRIVCLSQGRVAEFDTPQALLSKGPNGLFYNLVKEAGLLDRGAVTSGGPWVGSAGKILNEKKKIFDVKIYTTTRHTQFIFAEER